MAECQLNCSLSLHTGAEVHPLSNASHQRISVVFRSPARKNLQTALGLVVALAILATRTEKLFAEIEASLPHKAVAMAMSADHALPQPFDPARVPQSGGMAARLLAGISAKFV